jgi:hypothetical protein
MILRLTTIHENSLLQANSFTFNESLRYFHGSEESLKFMNSRTAKILRFAQNDMLRSE